MISDHAGYFYSGLFLGLVTGFFLMFIVVVTTVPGGKARSLVCNELYDRTLTVQDSLYLTTNTYCKVKTVRP